MAKLFDRVGQSTATTGTGTVTLGGVITDATNGDLATFADMGAVAGNAVNYLITDGNNFEIGVGTLGGTGPGFTLTRGVIKSKISGTVGTTALTLSGTAKVYSVPANAIPNDLNFGTTYNYGTGNPNDTNYARVRIAHLGGSSGAIIDTEAGGTGDGGPLQVGSKNSTYLVFSAVGYTSFYGYGGPYLTITNGGQTQLTFDRRLQWTNGNSLSGTPDTGFGRNAAGIIEVNSGASGTYRDLIGRNLRTSPTTVASLTAAATAGAGARSFVTDASSPTWGATVAGGGAVSVPVFSDGTNWKVG